MSFNRDIKIDSKRVSTRGGRGALMQRDRKSVV